MQHKEFTPFKTVDSLLTKHKVKGRVLGVGDSAKKRALLNVPYLRNSNRTECVGINIDKAGVGRYEHFEVIFGNAHSMPFDDSEFSAIICFMMLEHDHEFWLTVAEMKRVLKVDGLLIVGVPAFYKNYTEDLKKKLRVENSTICYEVHDKEPLFGDYYRFSTASLKKFVFQGFREADINVYGTPPRLIGSGLKEG